MEKLHCFRKMRIKKIFYSIRHFHSLRLSSVASLQFYPIFSLEKVKGAATLQLYPSASRPPSSRGRPKCALPFSYHSMLYPSFDNFTLSVCFAVSLRSLLYPLTLTLALKQKKRLQKYLKSPTYKLLFKLSVI